MNQYIITEEQLKDIEDGDLTLKQLKEIRSHPYNPQAEQCVYWGSKEGKNCCSLLIPDLALYVELTGAIRKDERETVLDEVLCKLTDEIDDRTRTFKGLHLAIKIVRELRKGDEQE